MQTQISSNYITTNHALASKLIHTTQLHTYTAITTNTTATNTTIPVAIVIVILAGPTAVQPITETGGAENTGDAVCATHLMQV
mgnify:CR=1 FL=1